MLSQTASDVLGLQTFLQVGRGGGGSSECEKLFGIFSTEERLGNDALDHQQLRHCYTHSAM